MFSFWLWDLEGMATQTATIGHLKQLQPVPREYMETEDNGAGQGLFYFHEPGDYLLGYLLRKQKRETFHYNVTTYKIKAIEGRQDGCNIAVKEDQVIEIPANIKMRRIIEDHDLIGSLVKIVYTGKRGRIKKYDVFKDIGTLLPKQEQKNERTRRKRQKRVRKTLADKLDIARQKQGGSSSGNGR